MSGAQHDMTSGDPIEVYLDRLRAGLRVAPHEADLILAEAEDHLRETAAAGLAIGMTEREAQEAAISSFGSVRAVVRAHQARYGRLTAVLGDLGLAVWKLGGQFMTTFGAIGMILVGVMGPGPVTISVSRYITMTMLRPYGELPRWLLVEITGIALLGAYHLVRRLRHRGHEVLLGGFFPVVAIGLIVVMALTVPALAANGTFVPGMSTASAFAAGVLSLGYAFGMGRTLIRQSRYDEGALGRVARQG